MKSPFDSEQDECTGGDSQINLETNDIDLAFSEQVPSQIQQQSADQFSRGDTALTADNEYYQLMFNLYLITCYQATNIAEAYMTQQHL